MLDFWHMRWRLVTVLVPLCLLGADAWAHAQEVAAGGSSEGIDDPKLARRLGTRIALGGPAEGEAPALGLPETAAAVPEGEVLARAPQAEPPALKPRLKLGYRRYAFSQIGATQATTPGASEPFDVVSLDFYPVSSMVRFGLTAQYGWQEGTFRQNGDAFFAGGTSLGFQVPGPVLTPFIEGFADAGLLQRTKSDLGLNTIASVLGELGIDVGSEVFLAHNFCLSFAVGYIHLANGYARANAFDTFSVDTWSFKLGLGL
jgi:hypothetical protein